MFGLRHRPVRSRRSRWQLTLGRRVLAAVCLGGAAALTVDLCTPPAPSSYAVVTAARDLPSGIVLTDGDLAVADVPGLVGPVGTRVEEFVGRQLAAPIGAGEALSATRVVPRSTAEGLPPGQVALHVRVVDPAALRLLSAGLRVALHDPDGQPLAVGVVVLAVDPPPDASGLWPAGSSEGIGLVVALPRDRVPAVLARRGIDPSAPLVHVVLEG